MSTLSASQESESGHSETIPDTTSSVTAIRTPPGEPSSGVGLLAAFIAYVVWAILPIFWKALGSVSSLEVLCHRVAWSLVMILPFMFMRGRLGTLLRFLKKPRNLLGLACSAYLLAGNWYLYIWAITHDMILEASLGYYINPLVSILFGIVVFRERVSCVVWLSIAMAMAGVLYQVIRLGHFPFVPLGLAFSFALYALLRKILIVEALPGLFMETLLVLPPALGYLVVQALAGNSAFFRGDLSINALLIGTGIITTIPLILFAYAARRIRMTSIGILQYTTPTGVFLLGVFAYNEPFTRDSLVVFSCIWAALALYTWETIRKRQW